MLAQLREIWIKEPEWRLGQIIVNTVGQFEECKEVGTVYCIEDDKLERLLTVMSSTLSKMRDQSKGSHDRP